MRRFATPSARKSGTTLDDTGGPVDVDVEVRFATGRR